MAVLRIRPCGHCGRRSEITERNGGWTVDCCYSSPIVALEENEEWCEREYRGDEDIFDSPDQAILEWNKGNPISGIEHHWKLGGKLFDGDVSAWYCLNPKCLARTIREEELKIKDCIDDQKGQFIMKDTILGMVDDLISSFLYYDRKEDEDIGEGDIEKAIKSGDISVEEVVLKFETSLKEALEDD